MDTPLYWSASLKVWILTHVRGPPSFEAQLSLVSLSGVEGTCVCPIRYMYLVVAQGPSRLKTIMRKLKMKMPNMPFLEIPLQEEDDHLSMEFQLNSNTHACNCQQLLLATSQICNPLQLRANS